MLDSQVNTDNFNESWEEFLKSKISCKKCGQGPYNYSTILSKGKIISKYDGFCSGGCAMTVYGITRQAERLCYLSNIFTNKFDLYL